MSAAVVLAKCYSHVIQGVLHVKPRDVNTALAFRRRRWRNGSLLYFTSHPAQPYKYKINFKT